MAGASCCDAHRGRRGYRHCLPPFAFRFMQVSISDRLSSFFFAGLFVLTLGSLGVIVRLALVGFGIGLIVFSRDARIEGH
jgi:hypothetical protein